MKPTWKSTLLIMVLDIAKPIVVLGIPVAVVILLSELDLLGYAAAAIVAIFLLLLVCSWVLSAIDRAEIRSARRRNQ